MRAIGPAPRARQSLGRGSLIREIQACARERDLTRGRKLHSDAVASAGGTELDLYVACSLIGMYASCGRLDEARGLFEKMKPRDVIAWNALMLGYAENGDPEEALDLLGRMDCPPDDRSFLAGLKACSALANRGKKCGKNPKISIALVQGISIHSKAAMSKRIDDIYVSSCLVDMYAKCGVMSEARRVFDAMKNRNVVAWNSLLLGFVESGDFEPVFDLFQSMQSEGCQANSRTFVALLKACSLQADLEEKAQGNRYSKLVSLERSMAIHRESIGRGFDSDRRAFERAGSFSDVVLWTGLILGHAGNGEGAAALELFVRMLSEVRRADDRVYVAGLKACSSFAEEEEEIGFGAGKVKLRSLEIGMALHAEASKQKFLSNIFVANCLVDLYSKCGSFRDSYRVFQGMAARDTVSWNSLILGCVENRESSRALELVAGMQQEGIEPDVQTIVAALSACTNLAAEEEAEEEIKMKSLELAMAVHALAQKFGCEVDGLIGNFLVEIYGKCGSLFDAQRAFDRLLVRTPLSWNLMMFACLEAGKNGRVLELFEQMKQDDLQPDSRVFSTVLKACSCVAALELGRGVHGECCRRGMLEIDAGLVASLVDLYGKCGSSSVAQIIFDSAPVKNVSTWNVLLAALSRLGKCREVFSLFHEMVEGGFQPNGVTFISVLGACRHSGRVEPGLKLFEEMPERYGVIPQLEHFHSLVDLLGRANRLDDAVKLVKSMPYKHNVVTWTTILNACLIWKNVRVGRIAFVSLLELKQTSAPTYVLMASIYESAGMVEEGRQLRGFHS